MKKRSLLIVLAIILFSSNIFAMDFIVGAKGGYFIWKPYFKEMKGASLSDVEEGDGILYGPVVSLIFTPDISFSVAGLTGKQKTHWYASNKYNAENDAMISGTYYADMKRTDIDSALSFRFMKSFKFFIGYKYQDIRITIKSTERRYSSTSSNERAVYENSIKVELPSHGPAVGLGYSMALGSGYFIAANLSGLYMWGKLDVKESIRYSYEIDPDTAFEDSTVYKDDAPNLKTQQLGLNFEPAIGYSTGEGGTIFTLGFRYQLLSTKFKEKSEITPDGRVSDHLYGVFVSVLFVF